VHPPNQEVVSVYDRFAGAYDRLVSPLQRRSRKRAVALLDAGEGDQVVEVGCGPGHALVRHAGRVGPSGRVLGIDAAWGMVRRARRRSARRALLDRIQVVRGDARALPLQRESADLVFVEDTLELFSGAEMEVVVAELHRIVREGGRLCVVTMEGGAGENNLFTRVYEWAFGHFGAFRRFGCRPIPARRLLRDGGFDVEAVERTRRAFIWPVEIILARSRKVEP